MRGMPSINLGKHQIRKEHTVTPNEIARLQAYLQAKFNNNMLKLVRRPKAQDSVEVVLGEEFLGVVYRDEDEGEVSYAMSICVLEEDLPQV
jgi:hypothetical protein